MQQLVSDFVIEQRLRWLDHLGCTSNDRLPKKVLLGELSRTRPGHRTMRRSRDVASSDVEGIGATNGRSELCQDRKERFELCKEGIESRPRQKNARSAKKQARSQ